MNPFQTEKRRLVGLFLVSLLVAPALVHAQGAKLQLNFEKLAAKAREIVDVTIDGSILGLASGFLSSAKPDEARVKELIAGLKGIYVKSYEFDVEGAYSNADVEAVRAQLAAPGWSRIVGVRSRTAGEIVEVYTRLDGAKMTGLAIIAAEPKEFTVVNIVGSIDLSKLRELEGQFGIPRMGLEQEGKPKKN